MKRAIAILVGLLVLAAPLPAQEGWPDLDTLLGATLANSGTGHPAYWLPDDVDPERATAALGILYEYIEGSAGSSSIAVGLYARSDQGWALTRRVENLLGLEPRDHRFFADRVELTTTTLGPGEARCCPTLPVRWSVARDTGIAQRLD